MDHNGLYADLDSFASISTCGTTSNSFNDTCPTLPSINNFKYQQTTNIYQQPVNDTQQKTLPQTQININNCNNNIFYPHDDVLFDANTAPTCASAATSNQSQKNNFIGHIQKELETTGGGGRENTNPLKNVFFNINNINTNIVNNIQNPTNFANSTDIFSGNQYHQINKNGETIINFTNNNLNSAGGNSMPADAVSATSQNYYGYQSNNSSQGQQTVYESSVQSQTQSQSSSAFLDPSLSAAKSNMNGSTGHYHSHHLNQNHTMTNGAFLPGTNSIPSEHSSTTVDPFSEFPETLSTAKIITNFESKNPLKYPSSSRPSGAYYKTTAEFPSHQYGHLPPHNYPGLYQPAKSHNYEPYQRIPRSSAPHYPTQHYAAPTIDEHNASRLNYNRTSAVPVHNPYHHPHALPHPPNNYPNYYSNGYGTMPYATYQTVGPPYSNPMIRNDTCSKPTTNYNKTSAVGLSPVEHGSYALPHGTNYMTPKKEFYTDNPYYPPPHPYYEDPMNNSCAKKSSSRAKVTNDIYNPNGATIFPDHHPMQHHQQAVRNVGYQPMPKLYSNGSQPTYSMPTNSCDLANPYHNFNYQHSKIQKMNPSLSGKQFKSYGHFEPLPHPHYSHPQYHTMQAKHPEKIKISIDLEEQINSSKIPKIPGYNYDPHHHHHYYQYHPHMPPRNPINDIDPKNSIPNINISLRDFLSTWNEIDEEDETGERRAATNGALDDLNEHVERTIMREYNPMFVQKATDSFMSASEVPSNSSVDKSQLSELESGIINEGTEKLYVLESIDVPISELNKYKHLSVINKLPENVVINDNDDSSMKFIEEIDLNREKLYKSEFELEFEACQERKSIDEQPLPPPVVVSSQEVFVEKPFPKEEVSKKSDSEEKPKEKKKSVKGKTSKAVESKPPKSKENLLKLKKEKIPSKDPRKARITKRAKKYSLNQRTSSVRTLHSTCVDFLNTSTFRNYAREQLSIINKHSKARILQDFKKKFNFDGMKRANAAVKQKLNHSVKMNSLREICGELLNDKSRLLKINESEEDVSSENCERGKEFPTLKELSKRVLTEMDINVVENNFLYSPLTLKELCESFIYSHNQYFLIEEVPTIPKLQDLCKNVLSETNIFINIDEEGDGLFALNNESEAIGSDELVDEDIYIVEENSENVGELFESEQLNSFERSEILRKIQRVANIEDDDEIIRAIGALHRDDDVESITNNNNRNVTNKNFSETNEFPATNEVTKFESEMSFMSFMEDDLLHSVQYEEIINDKGDKATKKITEILRFKHLNRSDIKQATKTIRAILKKSLTYQRSHRFRNAKRRDQIEFLTQQARAAYWKLKEMKNCDKTSNDSSSERSPIDALSPINQRESENESHYDAKDDTKAQSTHETIFNSEPTTFIDDSPDDCFGAQAELNFPKLPAMFPSINEYKLDRKSSRSDVKDIDDAKRRRLTFDESLLSIEKQEVRRSSTSSRRHHRQHSSRHHSSRSHQSSRSYHKHSSRHNNYTNPKDQMNHSEVKRLVIPSYKLYDKDLDVKLKIMPFVRIEREEKVDDLVKQYN